MKRVSVLLTVLAVMALSTAAFAGDGCTKSKAQAAAAGQCDGAKAAAASHCDGAKAAAADMKSDCSAKAATAAATGCDGAKATTAAMTAGADCATKAATAAAGDCGVKAATATATMDCCPSKATEAKTAESSDKAEAKTVAAKSE